MPCAWVCVGRTPTGKKSYVVGYFPSEAMADQEEILLRGLPLNGEACGLPAPQIRQPPRGSGRQGGHPDLVRRRVPITRHHPGNIAEASHVAEHFLPQGILVFPEVRGAKGPSIDVYDVHLGAAGVYDGMGPAPPAPVWPWALWGSRPKGSVLTDQGGQTPRCRAARSNTLGGGPLPVVLVPLSFGSRRPGGVLPQPDFLEDEDFRA